MIKTNTIEILHDQMDNIEEILMENGIISARR